MSVEFHCNLPNIQVMVNCNTFISVPPLIRVPQQLVQASLGDSVIVECHVEAYPKAEHLWLHRGQRLGSDSKYHTSNSQDDLKTFMRLRVRVNQGSDFGTYRCTAQNSIGHTEAKITIIGTVSIERPFCSPLHVMLSLTKKMRP